MDNIRDLLIEELDNTDVVHCVLSDGNSCDIGTANYWIGGEEGQYMCDMLGNVSYSSKAGVVNALCAYLNKIDLTISEID